MKRNNDTGKSRRFSKIQEFLRNHLFLLACILVTILLRIPSLLEPYWHGDEGVTLALGQAIRHGFLIYRDIADNKPPLLYLVFAIGGTLEWAKLALLIWSIGTVTSFYFLTLMLLSKRWAIVSSLLFSLIVNIPLFEGNIANGEIFFILPTTLGMLFLWKFRKSHSLTSFFFTGAVFSMGFLFKVPAVADFLAALIFLPFLEKSLFSRRLFSRLLAITVGFATPFGLTILAFFLLGAIHPFWINVFGRNFSYASWENYFRFPYLVFLAISLLLLYRWRRTLPKALLLVIPWFLLAVLGSRISIRPYTHYLIQVLPALFLAVFLIFDDIRHNFWVVFIPLFFFIVLVPQFPLDRGSIGYQFGYYKNFIEYKTGTRDILAYRNFFDPHVQRTYDAAAFLQANTLPSDSTFIWSDDALIYGLARRTCATPFVVAYITHVWDPSFADSVRDLSNKRPIYILVSTERIGVYPFPFLSQFISDHYHKVTQFRDIIVYKWTSK